VFFKEFRIIAWFLKFVPYINVLNIGKIVEDNRELLLEQLDFKKEIENMRIFKEKNKMFDFLTIPRGYSDITEKYNNVIVMQDIKGLTIRDIKDMSQEIKTEFGELLLKIGINSILFTGTLHNDLHSGNIFFYISSQAELNMGLPKYRIGLIDFGICNCIEGPEQDSYFYFFYNILTLKQITNIDKNIQLIKLIIQEDDKLKSMSQENFEEFYKDLIKWLDTSINSSQLDLGLTFLYNLIYICKKWNFTISKNFNKCCLSIQCMNTIGKELLYNPLETQNKITKQLIEQYENVNSLLVIN